MAKFRPISPTLVNRHLAEDLTRFLRQNGGQINPTVLCSSKSFEANIDNLSSRFNISPSSLIFSVKAMPVHGIIDLALSKGLRLLVYGLASVDELFGSQPSAAVMDRCVVGDSDISDEIASSVVLERGARTFLFTRLDSYYTLVGTAGPDVNESCAFYALTGIPTMGKYWANARVIPAEDLAAVGQPVITNESRGGARFAGAFIYSGNPFSRQTRLALEERLLTPSNVDLISGRECFWGGLGKRRDVLDFELQQLMGRLPDCRHGLDAGTALVYNASAVVAKVHNYRYPVAADGNTIFMEWGLAGGAHDLRYVYSNEVLDVLLIDQSGNIVEPGQEPATTELALVGESMASDDSHFGTLGMPQGMKKEDIAYIAFLDAQYVLAFELKRHFLGGYHPLHVVVL